MKIVGKKRVKQLGIFRTWEVEATNAVSYTHLTLPTKLEVVVGGVGG